MFQVGLSPEMLSESQICDGLFLKYPELIFTQGLRHGLMVKRIVCHSMSFVRGGRNAFQKMCGESCIPARVQEYWARSMWSYD